MLKGFLKMLKIDERLGEDPEINTEEDNYAAGEEPKVELTVKWFNPSKGYGFLLSEDGTEDIFLHFSILDEAGYRFLNAGDRVVCCLNEGTEGNQVVKIYNVYPENQNVSHSGYYDANEPLTPKATLEVTEGQVKWFNTIKGFGFICPDDGGVDVFVHASVLRRLGLHKVYPGQRVRMQVINSDRGRQAWSLELAS